MYTPLKVTTDYTLLKSLIKVKDLINFCVSKNIKSCAICDTNLFGVIEFYKLAKSNNIKPIIGLEITLNKQSIYLYAENYLGYKNLLKINTIICERDLNILELQKFSDNILVIIPFKNIQIYDDLKFIKHLYIGYENNEELQNSLIITKNVVYLNDIKTFNKEDIKYLKYLDILRDEKSENKYLHNYFDYDNLTKYDLEKIDEVVSLLNFEISESTRYIPKYNKDIDSYTYLSNLCVKGLQKRLNGNTSKVYIDRLKYELSVIKKMGFVDYFLIVYDYVLYAKKNNILVGPGRGSAAGSLVSYVIGITDIDPIKYDLLFERFLNYERVSMPDIDIDFDNTKRELVIDYVKNKYGKFNVSGGLTFATLKTRLVLREVARILKLDDNLLNKFLKVIDKNLDLKNNLNKNDVKNYLNSYKELQELYKISMKLEGLKKNISTHAAGIVIGDRCLDEIIPMYKNNEIYLTGVGMEYLEDLGLLKMDFLALKNLSMISNILKNIKDFNLNNIPLDEKCVYELFCKGETEGIFQFETPSFKSVLPKYKPQNFGELVACIALVRPGPSNELATYIKRKEGKEKITYYHNSLESILKETYGVIVYQEQVINILVKMANYTYAEADNVRRAMSKKKMSILLKEKDNFIKKSIQNGYDENLAKNIFEHILKFASYGFNKAHSVSYAIISYWMAYLKVHYKSLFTFEMLNNAIGSTEKIKMYLNELKKDNLKLHPVSINYSSNNFILKDKKVILPFKLIKNIKSELIDNIILERDKNGLFTDEFDFFKRTVKFISKGEYKILINAGILKDFNINTKTLINNLDILINYGNLYNDLGEYALLPEINKEEEYDNEVLRINEINSYGFFISNHPASKYMSNKNENIMKITDIENNVFKNVICYVMIDYVKRIKTKKNEDMAFISASDETGEADFTIFPKNYYMLQNMNQNDMIKVWGTVSKRFDKYSIIINKVVKE